MIVIIVKGLLLVAPIYLSRLSFFNAERSGRKIFLTCLIVIFLVIAFTPFSFYGHILDYSVFCLMSSFLIGTYVDIRNIRKAGMLILNIAGIFILLIYVLFTSIFTPKIVDQYNDDKYNYTKYEKFEMVSKAPVVLEIIQNYGLIERRIYKGLDYPRPSTPYSDEKQYYDHSARKIIIKKRESNTP